MIRRIGKSACSARRSLSAFVLAAALLALPLFAVGSTRAATTGLVAAYSFNEGSGSTVGDASGTGNNGTTSNTTWSASGKYGGALSFNGTSARVNIPNSSSLQLTTAMTLEAWVNPSAVSSAWRDVIYKGNDNYYLEATSSASKPDAGLIAGGSYGDAYGTAALPANTWSFLTETYDGATLRLYVNGTQVAATAHAGSIATSTSQLQIGGDSIYGQYFSGLIDEVRIYNTALSAAAIQTDMATPVSGSSTTDTTPPSMPTALTTSAVGQTSLTLSWNPSSDNTGVTGYRTYLNGNQVGTSAATSYGYSNLSCATTYTLGVAAVDAAGNVSGIATLAKQTAACSDTTPPSAPGTLTGTAAASTEIDLSWGAATDNVGVTGYQIWRCQGAGCTTYSQLTQTTGSATTYKDLSPAPATTYSYQVRALDAAGNTGPYSNTTSATTAAATSGLVAAYSFNEGSGTTVGDASGTGNNGTTSNTTWSASGKYGGALSFNGTSARVNIPNSSSLQLTTAMTLEAWVNPSAVSTASGATSSTRATTTTTSKPPPAPPSPTPA